MTKKNTEVRATTLQRVDHLENGSIPALEVRVEFLEKQTEYLRRSIEAAERHLDGESHHLTDLRIAFDDHRRMTFGQRLRWLLWGG
jgi:hypothetical protein